MRAHRIDALLLLNEDEAVGVLDIDMAMMRQTPRLTPRSRAMLGAERDHALAMFGGHDDLAGDEDHDVRSFSAFVRSEEHTSELQSLMRISYPVFCLKNKKYTIVSH